MDNFSLVNIPETQVKGVECRFAVYVPPPSPELPDIHFVKESIQLKDGSVVPNIRMIYDLERPYWVTKRGFRNHKQHKEWELKSRLSEFRSTERQMHRRVAGALGMPWLKDLRGCLNEPYVYGIDISSTAVLKKSYDKPELRKTPFTIAELDIETNVLDDSGTPTMATLMMPPAYGKEAICYTVFTKAYAACHPEFLKVFESATSYILTDYVGDYRKSEKDYEVQDYPIRYVSEIVDNDMEMWISVFRKAHEWKPDFLSIWNMIFEMERFEDTCRRYGIDPKDVLCDPCVPEEYRYYKYTIGKAQKVTASDKKSPIKPSARWNYVDVPASFFIIDQMCSYRQTRTGTAEEPSYALDDILKKEIKMTKLKFEEANHIPSNTLAWHKFMQKNHPIEYAVYNRFDCIGPALLDEKIKDLSYILPYMAESSDFKKFPSQPRRAVDALHWYLLELDEPRVMGCTSKRIVDEFDDETLSRNEWIVALSAELITEDGLRVVKELPNTASRVYLDVGDLDVTGSYPFGEVCLNTSKETTLREIISIEGVHEDIFRMENMGVSAGHVNAVAWCMNMLNFPDHHTVLGAFLADHPGTPLRVGFEEARDGLHTDSEFKDSYPVLLLEDKRKKTIPMA